MKLDFPVIIGDGVYMLSHHVDLLDAQGYSSLNAVLWLSIFLCSDSFIIRKTSSRYTLKTFAKLLSITVYRCWARFNIKSSDRLPCSISSLLDQTWWHSLRNSEFKLQNLNCNYLDRFLKSIYSFLGRWSHTSIAWKYLNNSKTVGSKNGFDAPSSATYLERTITNL